MHPILTRPDRLASYLGAWLAIGALLAGVLSRQGLTLSEAAVLVLPLYVVYAFICLSAWYVCRAVPLRALLLPPGTGEGREGGSTVCGWQRPLPDLPPQVGEGK